MKRKNILLITADQWRGDCLSGVGHPHVKTPHIDSLIKDGTVFNQHYSVCVPCAPARASLYTGMYLQNHRVTRNGTPLDDRHSNIARELRQAGYTPKLFGYTDTTLDPRAFSKKEVCQNGYEGMMPGFEEGLLLPSEKPKQWLDWLKDKGYDFNDYKDAFSTHYNNYEKPSSARAAYPLKYNAEHSQTAFITKKVIEEIDDHLSQSQDSWCIHLSYFRPHPPFVAPDPYNKMYDPSLINDVDPISKKPNEHPWLTAARGPMGDWPESWIQKLADSEHYEQEVRQLRATYYGLISKVDHYIGKVIEHLKVTNEYENTLIIVTSDHGELMGDHGLFGKRGYFREAYHIPLIIRDPEQAYKKDIKAITESVDIMPTIIDWIGKSIPRQCDGRSLLPLINSNTPKNWRKQSHWEYDFHNVRSSKLERSLGLEMVDCKLNVISNNDYMYVYFANLPALFFDLNKDPKSENNVIDDPKYAELVLLFSQRLLTWRMRNDERVLTAYSVSKNNIFHRDD